MAEQGHYGMLQKLERKEPLQVQLWGFRVKALVRASWQRYAGESGDCTHQEFREPGPHSASQGHGTHKGASQGCGTLLRPFLSRSSARIASSQGNADRNHSEVYLTPVRIAVN